MQSAARIESSVGYIDVNRHIIEARPRDGHPRWKFQYVDAGDRDSGLIKEPDEAAVQALLETLTGVAWLQVESAHVQRFGRSWKPLPRDTAWAINQATGGLPVSESQVGDDPPALPVFKFIDDAWFHDPPVDCPPFPAHDWQTRIMSGELRPRFLRRDLGDDRVPLIPELPSLCRRPGIIQLGACDYVLDEPVFLYPGQILRGAGVVPGRDGLPGRGGTRIILRGPRARILAGRALDLADVCRPGLGLDGKPCVPGPNQVYEARLLAGRRFAETSTQNAARMECKPRSLLSPPESPRNWPFGSSVTLEDLAIVDERPTVTVHPALVDLRNVLLFRVARVALAARQPGRIGLAVGYAPQFDNADTGAYFNVVDGCRFGGLDVGIELHRANTTRILGCRFDLGDGATGLRMGIAGVITISHDDFAGPHRGSATAVDLTPAGKWSPTGACALDGRSGDVADRLLFRNTLLSHNVAALRHGPGTIPFGGGYWLAGTFTERPATRALSVAAGLAPVPRTDDLLLGSGISTTRAFLDVGPRPPEFTTANGSANLLADPGFRAVEPGVALRVQKTDGPPEQNTAGRWRQWHVALYDGFPDLPRVDQACDDDQRDQWDACVSIRRNLAPRVSARPARGGPAGPGMAPAVRFDLRAAVDVGDANARKVLYIQQFLVNSQNQPAVLEETRRMAQRLAGRPVQLSVWLRTNIPPVVSRQPCDVDGSNWRGWPVSGVAAHLLRERSTGRGHEAECLPLAATGRHDGDDRWALLVGAGAVAATWLPVTGGPRRRRADGQMTGLVGDVNAVRFGIRIDLDPVVLQGIPNPYVEICTPFVGTGLFAQPPRDAILTEDGGVMQGVIVPARGARDALTLVSGPGGAAIASLPSGRMVVGVTLRALTGAPRRVEIRTQSGRLVASGGPAEAALSLADDRYLPAGTRLAVVCDPPEAQVAAALALALPVADPAGAAAGY
ncbi:hypothetical protein L6V77_34590 [Myxococcota bacterium]|nr:hypothetical protein [Myxococcota bacterium]